MLTCADVVKLVTQYIEAELSAEDSRRFEEHVAICPPCRAFLGQARHTVALTGELKEEELSPTVEEHLLTAFRDWNRPK